MPTSSFFYKRSSSVITFFTLAIAIVCFEQFAIGSQQFTRASGTFSLAVTIDLLVVVPLLWYFFMVRKARLPLVSVIPPLLICFIIASALLPAANHRWLGYFEKVIAVAELGVLFYGVVKIRQIVRAYKQSALVRTDFIFNLTKSLETILGKSILTRVIVSEISVVRYGLMGWRSRREVNPGQTFFTTHKSSGYAAIFVAILMILVTETAAMHFLIRLWSPIAAIITTVSSIYLVFFLLADFVAIVKRPVCISGEQLILRVGLRCNTEIQLTNIKHVVAVKNYKNAAKDFCNARLIGCSPNILIELYEPVIVKGLYGKEKVALSIAINIDAPQLFINSVQSACPSAANN
ncbi:MAG: hypothetical protein ABIX01_22170 [Chitinophagaceae bacterium]